MPGAGLELVYSWHVLIHLSVELDEHPIWVVVVGGYVMTLWMARWPPFDCYVLLHHLIGYDKMLRVVAQLECDVMKFVHWRVDVGDDVMILVAR